jgi:hypothetical protein
MRGCVLWAQAHDTIMGRNCEGGLVSSVGFLIGVTQRL